MEISKLGKLLLLIFVICTNSTVFAAKYYKVNSVNYLQLPTEKPKYSHAEVYIQEDQSQTRDMMSKGLGKLGVNTQSKTINLDDMVVNIFADKIEKYADWSLFDGDVNLAEGNETLKVVLVYTPDDGARPMAAPMKNNKGNYQFFYRVAAKMRIYDNKKNLIIEKNFGTITGIGESKKWPKSGGGAVELFSIGEQKEETKEVDLSEKHPYTQACIEGAMLQAQRVLYGLYGTKEFNVPLGVFTINSVKESKETSKEYKKIIEGKKKILLTPKQTKKMQKCVDFWEGILAKTDQEEKWAVHYNLAIGYSWLLNDEKAIEHIHKVHELNSERFETVINKSGSFSKKDTDILEAYNTAEPFATYYAQGINNYPHIPALLDMDVYTMSHALAINNVIASNLDLPVPLPIFPFEPKNTGMKKCEGEISQNGTPILEFSYNLQKGDLESVSLKGAKDGFLKKLKDEIKITSKSDLHPSEKKRIHYSSGNSNLSASYSISPEMEFNLYNYNFKTPFLIEPYKIKGDLSSVSTKIEYGNYTAKLSDKNFIKNMHLSAKDWFSSEFVLGDSAHVTIGGKPYTVTVEVKELQHGLPVKYEIKYELKDVNVSLFAKIKTKFGETTHAENSRRLRAKTRMQPEIDKLLAETLQANGCKVNGNNITLTKTYDCNVVTDDQGNWTKIELGEYTIKRTIKY